MSELKIKVSIGSFNVELEGDSEKVIAQFDEIKKSGLGQIVEQLTPFVTKAPVQLSPLSEEATPEDVVEITKSLLPSSIPSLYDIVMRSLPKSEAEWVLVYGYFHTQTGASSFTRKDIIAKYDESKRKTQQRVKNLWGSIKHAISERWLNAINENDFIIAPDGNAKIQEILARTEATVKAKRRSPVKGTSNGEVAKVE